ITEASAMVAREPLHQTPKMRPARCGARSGKAPDICAALVAELLVASPRSRPQRLENSPGSCEQRTQEPQGRADSWSETQSSDIALELELEDIARLRERLGDTISTQEVLAQQVRPFQKGAVAARHPRQDGQKPARKRPDSRRASGVSLPSVAVLPKAFGLQASFSVQRALWAPRPILTSQKVRCPWRPVMPLAVSFVPLAMKLRSQAASTTHTARPLGEFQVGEAVEGTVVQIYCPGGISVDVGCSDVFAFIEVEEFADGWPQNGPFQYKPGDRISARVLDVNPQARQASCDGMFVTTCSCGCTESNEQAPVIWRVADHGEPDPHGEHGDSGKLHLTMRSGTLDRPERYIADTSRPANVTPFVDVAHDEWISGEVVMMSSWAAYVKVMSPAGDPFVGILSREDVAASFAQEVARGSQVAVRVKEVDVSGRRLLLTMLSADQKTGERHLDEWSTSNLTVFHNRAVMEKPDHAPDESKAKRPGPFKAVQPWAVGLAGAGLLMLCGGAFWLWRQAQEETRALHPHSTSWHSRGGKQVFEGTQARVFSEPAPEPESDSLEDVLSKLEGSDDAAVPLPRRSLATKKEEKRAKAKDTKSKKAGVQQAEIDDEKAKEVIRDTLKKLEEDGQGGKKGSKTRKTVEKLKALLGEVDEEPEPQELSDDQQSHMDFAKALQEEQKRKIHVEMKTVRSEFKRDFGTDARPLLCSGCKLVASRLSSELDTHDVHEQESPAQMLAAKRRAIDSTCSSLRHLQAVKPAEGEGIARFEASEVTGEGEREGKRLCAAILEESRFDILARLIQRKIPEMQHLAGGRTGHSNWERWLCAERMRLCKRSEVKDEEDDEIEQDL
ncbi:unnamed protein product, partial [Symbiodinium pilosum]